MSYTAVSGGGLTYKIIMSLSRLITVSLRIQGIKERFVLTLIIIRELRHQVSHAPILSPPFLPPLTSCPLFLCGSLSSLSLPFSISSPCHVTFVVPLVLPPVLVPRNPQLIATLYEPVPSYLDKQRVSNSPGHYHNFDLPGYIHTLMICGVCVCGGGTLLCFFTFMLYIILTWNRHPIFIHCIVSMVIITLSLCVCYYCMFMCGAIIVLVIINSYSIIKSSLYSKI